MTYVASKRCHFSAVGIENGDIRLGDERSADELLLA